MILPNTDRSAAQALADELAAAVLAASRAGVAPVCMSLGVAVSPEDGGSAAQLVGVADAALLAAKAVGRRAAEERSPAATGALR